MLSFDDLRIPDGWPILVGFDTGTFMSASFTAFCPDPYCALTIAEFPNYRYVGGEIELLGMSNHQWAQHVFASYNKLRPGTTKVHGWVDENTQFRAELNHYGLVLRGNPRKLELRVEISREYVQAVDPPRYYLAPWLTVLPYEMEHAAFPDSTTSSGRFEREKTNDHTLDTVEHVLSRRPRTKTVLGKSKDSFLDRFLKENRFPVPPGRGVDPHLGRH